MSFVRGPSGVPQPDEDVLPAWPAEAVAELSHEARIAFDVAATSLKRAVDTGEPALYRIAVLRIAAAADRNLADHTRNREES